MQIIQAYFPLLRISFLILEKTVSDNKFVANVCVVLLGCVFGLLSKLH